MKGVRGAFVAVLLIALLYVSERASGQNSVLAKSPSNAVPAGPKITVSRETTWAIEPLRPDGFVDYFEVINRHFGKDVSPENNAAVLLYEALGPRPEGGKRLPDEFYRRMGSQPPPDAGDHFKALSAWLRDLPDPPNDAQLILNQQAQAGLRPWKTEEFPLIAAWLDSNAAPLELIVRGVERPQYFLPVATTQDAALLDVLLPGVQASREVARALKARAMRELGEGSQVDAWRDLITLHRLGRHIGHGFTFIEYLVGIAIEAMAIEGEVVFLSETRPTSRTLARYCKHLDQLPPRSTLIEKTDVGERSITLDAVHRLARGTFNAKRLGVDDENHPLVRLLADDRSRESLDWDLVLKSVNAWYERTLDICRRPTVPERLAGLRELDQQLKALRSQTTLPRALTALVSGRPAMSQPVADALTVELLPVTNSVQKAEGRISQQMINIEAAFALATWQSEHDQFPESWEMLVPRYLPAVPRDLFRGKPLSYTRLPDGCRFYSIGVNEQDDGGRSFGETPPGDDLKVVLRAPRTP